MGTGNGLTISKGILAVLLCFPPNIHAVKYSCKIWYKRSDEILITSEISHIFSHHIMDFINIFFAWWSQKSVLTFGISYASLSIEGADSL